MTIVGKPQAGSEYAEYDGFTIEYRDASHRYWIHHDGQRDAVTSVTSALSVLDKSSLLKWYESMGIIGALELERGPQPVVIPVRDEPLETREVRVPDLDPEEVPDVVRLAGMGAEAKRDAGGDRGNAVHEALLAYCSLGTIPTLSDFEPEHRGYVEGLCKWLAFVQPTPVLTECIVGDVQAGFAGRFDLLADIDNETVLCDLKTSKRAFLEHHLQLAGYEIGLATCRQEVVNRSCIVSVREDGTYLETDGLAEGRWFREVLIVSQMMKTLKKKVDAAEKAAAAA